MPEYAMRSTYAAYAAMNVHSRSFTACMLNLATAETQTRRFNGFPSTEEIAE